MKKFILAAIFCCLLLPLYSQQAATKIKGVITDAETGEPVPFVVVYFKGTTIGVTSDLEGKYSIETRQNVPSVIKAELLGYQVQEQEIKPGGFTEVNFRLQPSTEFLNAVVIKADNKKIKSFLRRIYERKYKNDPQYKESYSCKTYSKLELGLTNINPRMKNRLVQKHFGFVFDYMDTSVISGKPYLPVMISENNSRTYYRQNPALMREIIDASRISGVENNYSLAQFTGQLYYKVNLYDNYISIFNVKIASPLCEHGFLYYDYYLVDSSKVNSRTTYKVRFHPKATSTPVFDGEFAIDSATMALESAHIKLAKGVNVNWIRDLVVDVENQLVDDSTWFYSMDKLYADFSITRNDSSKVLSFIGSRTVNYSDIVLNEPIPKEVLNYSTDIVYSDSVLRNSESYWEESRPFELSAKEKKIYQMVDSIKQVPMYNTIYNIVNTFLTGYYRLGKIEVGPYSKFISFNDDEGFRMQFGARTTYKFHDKWRFSGYTAYGFKDRKLKGGATVEYQFSLLPLKKLTFSYMHDKLRLGAGEHNFTESNILGSVFSKDGGSFMNLVDRWYGCYDVEWQDWIVNKFYFETNRIYGNDNVPMVQADGTQRTSIMTSTLGVGFRFGWNEAITRSHFSVNRVMRYYPVVTLDFRVGLKDLWNSYDYYRGELGVDYDIQIPPFGVSEFSLNAGKIWGGVPYPLLKLFEANTTYFNVPGTFACMEDYEFAADAWVTLFYEHNFKGFFLGKIPLLKRLQWREVLSFRGAYGSIEKKNLAIESELTNLEPEQILFPSKGMRSLTTPYLEAGLGITNIFKLFRVDAYWRLNHKHNSLGERNTSWVINFGVDVNF